MMEDGYDIVELPLPALMTVVKEINVPRMPSLRGKMKALKYEPIIWNTEHITVHQDRLGLKGSPTQVFKVFSPKLRTKGEIIDGESIDEKAGKLVSKLKEAKIL